MTTVRERFKMGVPAIYESGYERTIIAEHDLAVRWWAFRREGDGWCFARGGRCKTARIARRLTRQTWDEARTEHLREIAHRRKEARLLLDDGGTLRPPRAYA